MTIALVTGQTATGSLNGATSTTGVTVTWPSATTAGNLLLAAVVSNKASPGASAITGASGWTQYGTVLTGRMRVELWYIENAASQANTGKWTSTVTKGVGQLSVCVAEYSGIATASSKDVAAVTNTGSGATETTGTTATTAQADELIVAVFGVAGSGTAFSGPTNGFGITVQINAINPFAALVTKIVSATGTFSTGVTGVSAAWGSVIGSFKAAGGGGGSVFNPYFYRHLAGGPC